MKTKSELYVKQVNDSYGRIKDAMRKVALYLRDLIAVERDTCYAISRHVH